MNSKKLLISRKPPKFESDDRFLETKKKHLTKEGQDLVLRMIGQRENDQEIIRAVKKLTGKSVSVGMVRYYRKAEVYQKERERYAKQWDSYISDDEFSSKRRRLQELTDIYYALRSSGDPDTLKHAASVMSKIDEIVQGRKSTLEMNVQYNKYEGIPTEELIKKFTETSKILIE